MSQFQKVTIEERARRYLAAMDAPRRAPDDPQDSHTVVFNATRALIHGFGFTPMEARPFLVDYLQRSDLPWTDGEINHKLRQVDAATSKWPRGYLRNEEGWRPSAQQRKDLGIPTESQVRAKIDFELEKLQRVAAPWRHVDLVWLANRSAIDPATVTAAGFLKHLYRPGENVLCFLNEYTQGEACWPEEEPPTDGKCGVWFLPQPVCGEYLPNPEGKPGPNGEPPKPSRRIGRCVTAWRYLVIESDAAPLRDWLGFIVQVPLQIEALYTSGSRSIHALVRLDARTYEEWHAKKNALMPFLVACIMVGADRGVSSTGVRLSRLPGCVRHGKMTDVRGPDGKPRIGPTGRPLRHFAAFPGGPAEQKLLYLRPGADTRPICERPPERNVEQFWSTSAKLAIDGYENNTAELRRACAFYAKQSEALAAAARDLEEAK